MKKQEHQDFILDINMNINENVHLALTTMLLQNAFIIIFVAK